jgi:hypothetical protein
MNANSWKSNAAVVWRDYPAIRETPAEYVFHRPRLYLETTIPSYLTARTSRDLLTARRQKVTRDWWNSWRTNFEIYISGHVYREISDGNPQAAARRKESVASYAVLTVTERARDLTRRLMTESGLPEGAATDAGHVAVASVHKMEFLLTWNCAHLVNAQFAPKIASICESEGLLCPVLCTPEQLLARYEK